jgi:hypothetical protein
MTLSARDAMPNTGKERRRREMPRDPPFFFELVVATDTGVNSLFGSLSSYRQY